MTRQFGRSATLIVAPTSGGQGIDLSNLRFVFEIYAADVETPNYCFVKIYNVNVLNKQNTALDLRKLKSEYVAVTLQAGYEGNAGVIFQGSVKQLFYGRENPTDTYLAILAADADIPYNFGVTNVSLPAGSTAQQRLATVVQQMAASSGSDLTVGYAANVPLGPVLPRGKTLFGMGRSHLRDIGATGNVSISIQNGKVVVLPLRGYLPGEAVVLNVNTGLIGLPQQTDEGIRATCLLNPSLRVGGLVKLNNKDIIPATISPAYGATNYIGAIAADGLYRIYVVEYEGDTRGSSWYSHLTLLAIDQATDQTLALN